MPFGKTNLTLQQVRAFNEAQKLDYEVHKSDCRYRLSICLPLERLVMLAYKPLAAFQSRPKDRIAIQKYNAMFFNPSAHAGIM